MDTSPPVLFQLGPGDPLPYSQVQIRLALESETIESGTHAEGQLVITNGSDQAVEIHSGQPLTAVIVLPGTDSVVGAFTGAIAGVGREFTLNPGDEDHLPVIVPATGGQGSLLQPGPYAARAILQLFGDVGRLRILTPETPVTVVGGTD
jgi:hypothetical protein